MGIQRWEWGSRSLSDKEYARLDTTVKGRRATRLAQDRLSEVSDIRGVVSDTGSASDSADTRPGAWGSAMAPEWADTVANVSGIPVRASAGTAVRASAAGIAVVV